MLQIKAFCMSVSGFISSHIPIECIPHEYKLSAIKSQVQNQNRIMKTQHVGSIMEQRTYSVCNDSSGVIFK